MERRYENEVVGFNLRMTDIHAAIGRVQLRRLPEWNERRIKNAKFLSEGILGPETPTTLSDARHVFHQYTIKVSAGLRDPFIEGLQRTGVGSAVYYPIPVHRLPSFGICERCQRNNDGICDRLQTTDLIASQCLSLPVHPGLSQGDLQVIVDSVNQVYEELD